LSTDEKGKFIKRKNYHLTKPKALNQKKEKLIALSWLCNNALTFCFQLIFFHLLQFPLYITKGCSGLSGWATAIGRLLGPKVTQ